MGKQSKVAWDKTKTAGANASRVLPDMTRRFFRRGRSAAAPPASVDRLHEFRLETKRFRYTLELFRPCYGPGLEQRLASLRKIQQCLGDLNDCVSTEELLLKGTAGSSQLTKRMKEFLNTRTHELTAEFCGYWMESFDAAGQEKWWTEYLTRYAGRTRKIGAAKP